CCSTMALRAWLENRRDESIAAGKTVPRPPAKPDEPTPEVADRERRIDTLAASLRAGLPADPARRSEEQRGRALLADLLGYFRREEKCAFWEHFRLRALETDELHGEREALTGLRSFRSDPPVGRQKTPTDHY